LSVASKRRQGGKVETHSELVRGRESADVEEVVIAIVRGERDQQQQGTCNQS
jgi:predicted transcriptional regulator